MKSWQTDDKEWMKQRKKEWKYVKTSLKESKYKSYHIKDLQKYFMTGELPEIDEYDDRYFCVIHKMWFDPDKSEGNWKKMLENSDIKDFNYARTVLHFWTNEHMTEYGKMGGLEERLIKIFYPETDPEKTFSFNGREVPALDYANNEQFVATWINHIRYWLEYSYGNPYCFYQYVLEHFLNSLHILTEPEIKELAEDRDNFHPLLRMCANFVDPWALPGTDTTHKRFVKRFKNGMERESIPQPIKNIWQKFLIRDLRSGHCQYEDEELRFENWTDPEDLAVYNDFGLSEDSYCTYTVHSKEINPEHIKIMVSVFNELGFTEDQYNPLKIEAVNLGDKMTGESILRLGYQKGDDIPGFRYRIKTNENYVDSTKINMSVDLIIPLPQKEPEKKEDTPVFYVLPRPEKPTWLCHHDCYRLNVRMTRRLFKHKTGDDLLRYSNLGVYKEDRPGEKKKKLKDPRNNFDPYYQTFFQPFINIRRAFEDKPEYDFKKWEGESLPSIFKQNKTGV